MSIWKRGFASGLSQGGTGIQDGTYDSTQENKARVKGPWQVHVVAALPLRSLSRIYGGNRLQPNVFTGYLSKLIVLNIDSFKRVHATGMVQSPRLQALCMDLWREFIRSRD